MKKIKSLSALVYSTNPDFKLNNDTNKEEVPYVLAANQQIKIKLETKHRAGKAVTLVENYIAQENMIEALGKKLKAYCGTGGSVKNGEIIIQGDQRDKVLQWFYQNGYTAAKKI